jgi:C-terminal processing protease CtpA/Prc
VSAGEAFLLSAMRNTKVTVFGENTGGVIDLQNVRIVRLACHDRGLLLGYPTIAASAKLPDGGLNATGIAPDVRIPAGVEDPIAFILSHYRETDRH